MKCSSHAMFYSWDMNEWMNEWPRESLSWFSDFLEILWILLIQKTEINNWNIYQILIVIKGEIVKMLHKEASKMRCYYDVVRWKVIYFTMRSRLDFMSHLEKQKSIIDNKKNQLLINSYSDNHWWMDVHSTKRCFIVCKLYSFKSLWIENVEIQLDRQLQ